MSSRRGLLTILLTIAISLALLLLPTYESGVERFTLFQVNGYRSFVLVVPVAISALGLFSNPLRLFAGLLMALWVAAAIFTVGLFYLPIVGCLLWPARHRENNHLLTLRQP